jgi:HAD superfamily hydrolase (TIGR01509 family)
MIGGTVHHGVLQAVLFDMDGLLIDSERHWLTVETEVMAWLGGEWGPEHQHLLVGGSLDQAVRVMLELSGADVAPARVARRLLDGMADYLAEGVPMMPGAKDLLAEVRAAGLPTALVSSSHRRLVEPVLDVVGRDNFTLTLAGDEVTRTKPDPEPYRTATARLEVDPGRGVVLEDSLNGVTAAQAAGCPVVAVPNLVPIPAAPGRLVVASLQDVTLARLAALVTGTAG